MPGEDEIDPSVGQDALEARRGAIEEGIGHLTRAVAVQRVVEEGELDRDRCVRRQVALQPGQLGSTNRRAAGVRGVPVRLIVAVVPPIAVRPCCLEDIEASSPPREGEPAARVCRVARSGDPRIRLGLELLAWCARDRVLREVLKIGAVRRESVITLCGKYGKPRPHRR